MNTRNTTRLLHHIYIYTYITYTYTPNLHLQFQLQTSPTSDFDKILKRQKHSRYAASELSISETILAALGYSIFDNKRAASWVISIHGWWNHRKIHLEKICSSHWHWIPSLVVVLIWKYEDRKSGARTVDVTRSSQLSKGKMDTQIIYLPSNQQWLAATLVYSFDRNVWTPPWRQIVKYIHIGSPNPGTKELVSSTCLSL